MVGVQTTSEFQTPRSDKETSRFRIRSTSGMLQASSHFVGRWRTRAMPSYSSSNSSCTSKLSSYMNSGAMLENASLKNTSSVLKFVIRMTHWRLLVSAKLWRAVLCTQIWKVDRAVEPEGLHSTGYTTYTPAYQTIPVYTSI
ncbi:hypothetical protein BABINDRAFT_162209 [Babjeviella inositovora NRRL Y-12698]|uniref:Uncharacterized protein n=1 Tax=Babjeviella inositovora NRRL Y-12698 TaxID=984486 RepID=A0A1E3QNY0_9ASCO|nr:uncharacterized protein BABINDRAFT_162209 [Babjeviella inositovora NRRL Y-12698]ODQ79154.1 hypothetical protein BABINDRAFT_162209 [Babjeviella inositovora NRRL Y-12698]